MFIRTHQVIKFNLNKWSYWEKDKERQDTCHINTINIEKFQILSAIFPQNVQDF